MIDYLLDAYRLNIYNMQKRKLKELTKKEWGFLSLSIIFGIIFIISMFLFNKNAWIITITFLIFAIVSGIIFKSVEKDSIKNYSSNLVGYKIKLGKLRDTLKNYEFNLYSREKLDCLIEICDERLKSRDLFSRLTGPIVKVFTSTIIPIITFIFGLLADKASMQVTIEYSVLILMIIIYFTGVFYMIYPLIKSSINKEQYILKSLRDELYDIKMIDFLNNDANQSTK